MACLPVWADIMVGSALVFTTLKFSNQAFWSRWRRQLWIHQQFQDLICHNSIDHQRLS